MCNGSADVHSTQCRFRARAITIYCIIKTGDKLTVLASPCPTTVDIATRSPWSAPTQYLQRKTEKLAQSQYTLPTLANGDRKRKAKPAGMQYVMSGLARWPIDSASRALSIHRVATLLRCPNAEISRRPFRVARGDTICCVGTCEVTRRYRKSSAFKNNCRLRSFRIPA